MGYKGSCSIAQRKMVSLLLKMARNSIADLLGLMSARTLALANVGVALGTIFLCYGLALAYGHVPVWIPMISDCAVLAPEKYPFRFGIITAAVLLALNAWVGSCFLDAVLKPRYPKWAKKLGLAFALLAAIGLGTVGAVNEKEDNPLHSAGAVVFFLFYLIFMIMTLVRMYQGRNRTDHVYGYRVAHVSVAIKVIATILTFVSEMSLIYYSSKGDWSKWQPHIAFSEWMSVLWIEVYNTSFALDFGAPLKIAVDYQEDEEGEEEDYTLLKGSTTKRYYV